MGSFCTNCGTALNQNSKFCTKCGKKISTGNDNNTISEKKTFVFKSLLDGKVEITIQDNKVTISRPGVISKLSHGFTGEKTILINQISSIQLKKVGFSRGYLQFIISGHEERKSGIVKGEKDENIVYFDNYGSQQSQIMNNNAEIIKNYIEQYNSKLFNNPVQPVNVIKEEDKYDKLEKLKKLLDSNVITQEEFDNEKKKLLNK